MNRTRIAVAGAGLIGVAHMRVTQASSACTLTAVVDPAPGGSRQLVRLPPATQLRGLSWTRDGVALTVGLASRTGDIVLAERKE